jgi:UDP-N-acetylmuramate dehydrogenase
VLFTRNFDGIVARNTIGGIEILSDDGIIVTIRAGAGVNWHDLVVYALKNNLGGIENLSLIPGTVGAAPMQNIGAYGAEIKDVFANLEAVNRQTGIFQIFDNQDCQFGYRNSIFKSELKDKYIISSVTLNLTCNHKINTSYGAIEETLKEWSINNPTIQDVSKAVISIRSAKLPDPKKIGNAGSFFKNPVITLDQYYDLKKTWTGMPGYTDSEGHIKVPAAWLIEKSGWKGKRRGEIGVHENQALVLVNFGQGSGKDLFYLAEEIQKSVHENFRITLNPEVNII